MINSYHLQNFTDWPILGTTPIGHCTVLDFKPKLHIPKIHKTSNKCTANTLHIEFVFCNVLSRIRGNCEAIVLNT